MSDVDDPIAVGAEAIARVRRALAELHYNQAIALTAAGRLDDAVGHYDAALGLAPGWPEALDNLGALHAARGQPDAAALALRAALAVDATRADTLYNLATVEFMVGDAAGAAAHFAAAAAARPGFALALRGEAQARAALDETSAALALAVQAAELADDADACAYAAMLHLQAEAPAEALRWATRAAALLDEAGPHSLVGAAHAALGDHAAALAAYARAAALAPDRLEPHFNCAVMAEALLDYPAAIAHFRRAHAVDRDHRPALINLTRLLIDVGHDQPGELAACLEHMLALDPDDPMARHLLDGVRGHVSAVAPPRYIAEMFDAVADDYDAMMLDRLGYQGPTLVTDALTALGVARCARALDLGCGSGLIGATLRPRVGWLGGVDLAPRMLALAEARGIYDRLDHADVVEHLRAGDDRFELIVAGDVMIYLGDLAPVFAGVRARLAPGGLWLFTVEESTDDDVRLHPTGRYAHHRDYLTRTLAAHGLAAVRVAAGALRVQAGQPVPGLVVAARAAG